MPKKWVTLKEFVNISNKEIVSKSLGISVSALNNYLYKGTEPCGALKVLCSKMGIKEWWLGEVPIPAKIKRFRKDRADMIRKGMVEGSIIEMPKRDKSDIGNTTTDDILGS